jgi:multidrug transporter EmrE-like cation transporter
MNSIVDKYGLTVETALIAAFFVVLFASMANAMLTGVAYGIMAVVGLVSVAMVGKALRGE